MLFIRWEKSNAVMISHQVRRLRRRKFARLLSLRAAESFNRTSKNIYLYLYARIVGGRRYYSGLFSVFARRKYRYSIFQPENTRRRFFIFYGVHFQSGLPFSAPFNRDAYLSALRFVFSSARWG